MEGEIIVVVGVVAEGVAVVVSVVVVVVVVLEVELLRFETALYDVRNDGGR
jgi:hypothetical protein